MADKEYSNEHPKYKKKHWTEIPAKGWNEVLKEDREFRKKLREKNIKEKNTEWDKMKRDLKRLKNFFSGKQKTNEGEE